MVKYFTLFLLMLVPAVVMAQEPRDGGNEKFNPETHRQKQHAFMMQKAQLTKDDSVKFFAIYDEMRQKERELYGDSHEMRQKRPETDAECRAAMLHVDSLELASKQLQCDYHQRLLDAISPKKAALAIMAGDEFDRMTFRNMMRDWKHVGKEGVANDGNKGKRTGKKGKKNVKCGVGDFEGPQPHPDFHGAPHGGPGMEGGPEGPRPDGPAPDGHAPKE